MPLYIQYRPTYTHTCTHSTITIPTPLTTTLPPPLHHPFTILAALHHHLPVLYSRPSQRRVVVAYPQLVEAISTGSAIKEPALSPISESLRRPTSDSIGWSSSESPCQLPIYPSHVGDTEICCYVIMILIFIGTWPISGGRNSGNYVRQTPSMYSLN